MRCSVQEHVHALAEAMELMISVELPSGMAPKLDLKGGAEFGSAGINDSDELGNPRSPASSDSEDSIGDQFRSSTIDSSAVAEQSFVTDGEFYSNLVFLAILRPFMGERERRTRDLEFIDKNESTTTAGAWRDKEFQRDFLDRLCYLVDYKKGGDTITAAAVEFVPQNKQLEYIKTNHNRSIPTVRTVKLWFAANNAIDEEAWNALVWVQNLIKSNQDDADAKSEEELVRDICEKFIALASCRDQSKCCHKLLKKCRPGAHRINTYAKKMRIAGKKVREWLALGQKPTNTGAITNWIDGLRNETDQFQLVSKCYDAWWDKPYSVFLREPLHPSAPAAMYDFVHFVARLGAHKYAAMRVAAGIKRLSYCRDFRVEFDRLPRQSHIEPLQSTVSLGTGARDDDFEADPWKIIHRLSQKYPKDSDQLAAGYLVEERRRGENGVIYSFADEVRKWVERRDGQLVTRYHAELQIATFFSANSAYFFENDRYVACSKGACWFCHQYLKLLEGKRGEKFVEPARHNEVLPGVSFPQPKSAGADWWVRMRVQMNEVVLQAIRDALLGDIPEHSKHAQSTSTWMDEAEIRSIAKF